MYPKSGNSFGLPERKASDSLGKGFNLCYPRRHSIPINTGKRGRGRSIHESYLLVRECAGCPSSFLLRVEGSDLTGSSSLEL